MARRFLLLVVCCMSCALLHGCEQANPPASTQDHTQGTKRAAKVHRPVGAGNEGTGPGPTPNSAKTTAQHSAAQYKIIETERFKDNFRWNDGPLAERGVGGAHLAVRVKTAEDMRPAYGDITSKYPEYDLMIITFYEDDAILNEWYYARTPAAEQALQAETRQNQGGIVE